MGAVKKNDFNPAHIMKVHECAAFLGMKERWVRSKVQEGSIPFYKMGRFIVFYKPEIIKWFKGNKVA